MYPAGVRGHLRHEGRPRPDRVFRFLQVPQQGQEGLVPPIPVWLRPGRVMHWHGGVQEEGEEPGQDERGVAVHVDIMFIS